MSIIIIRGSFTGANLAIVEALFVVPVFAVRPYGRTASVVVHFVRNCFQMLWIAASSNFAKMVNHQSLRNWLFEKFVNVPVNPCRHAFNIDVPISAMGTGLNAANPYPASRVGNGNFHSHPLWKGTNVKTHIFTPTVAHRAAVGVFVYARI